VPLHLLHTADLVNVYGEFYAGSPSSRLGEDERPTRAVAARTSAT